MSNYLFQCVIKMCYKKNVHIKINAILNKTNILQFFDERDHLFVVSVEQ